MTLLRVATYNVYLGADLTGAFDVRDAEEMRRQAWKVHAQLVATDFPARARAIARILVREAVDIVGLQEVARWSRADVASDGSLSAPVVLRDFLTELLDAFEELDAPYDAHAPNANFHGGAELADREWVSVLGFNVILVRRDSGVEVDATRTGDFASSLDIPTGIEDVVVNIPRSWGWVDGSKDGTPFRFVNTHTEAYDAGVRAAQRDELLAVLGEPAGAVLVVGDFNATPDSVGMPSTYTDAWAVAGDGDGSTCGQAADLANEASMLDKRIDYVWVRGGAVLSCSVIGSQEADRTAATRLWPSDHAGVVAHVEI